MSAAANAWADECFAADAEHITKRLSVGREWNKSHARFLGWKLAEWTALMGLFIYGFSIMNSPTGFDLRYQLIQSNARFRLRYYSVSILAAASSVAFFLSANAFLNPRSPYNA